MNSWIIIFAKKCLTYSLVVSLKLSAHMGVGHLLGGTNSMYMLTDMCQNVHPQ